ncbi:hypothetical protein NKR23_g11829 [Pleurostoma richardsiae]|uniref:Large ribosomal subunit protein mL46 n=1 Tax=Pleurostoma richardsiae TaxID=41990 RepID=A0AA38R0Z6_9PEZI|nr:hypothetical protein NKR23_g11829 [Pleurostoma richardsiae]
MSASSRGSRAALPLLRRQSPRICSQCARGQFSFPARAYSAASAAVEAGVTTPPLEPTASSSPSPVPFTRAVYRIKSGIILSRPPLLTRKLTPFESAFFLYQKRLNERLTAPFSKKFYFKKDTALDLDWKIKVRERGTVGKEVGRYSGVGRNAWDDEVLVGSELADQDRVRETLLRDAELRVSEDGEELSAEDRVRVEQPMPRETEADRTNDVRRLDRKLDRTLYLVVKGSDDTWGFPADDVRTDENLHEAAARVLAESAGVNMNTWIVGRAPIGHLINKPVFKEDGTTLQRRGDKIFFLKGRIMAGQADLTDNTQGLVDFKWLTGEELEKELTPHYFQSIRNTMAER